MTADQPRIEPSLPANAEPTEPVQSAGQAQAGHSSGRTFGLALAALGVVYGDIGTSPLYAVKECFHGQHAVALLPVNIMGVL